MRLAASGQLTAAQIAEQLGISRRRFFDWVNALKAGGVAGLLERVSMAAVRRRKSKANVLEELLAGLAIGPVETGQGNPALAAGATCSIRLKLPGVYYWLGKLGGVLKVPRKTHAQKDAAKPPSFSKRFAPRLKNLNVAGGKPVRIWVADEHRYGLIPVVRKCWTLAGLASHGAVSDQI